MCVFVSLTHPFTLSQFGSVPPNLFVNVSVGDVVVMFAMVIFWWVGVLPYDFGVDMARVPVTGG